MSHQLHNSLTRILTADGIPVGVGFIASENLILTCTHVIEQASGSDNSIHIDLPLLAPGESFSGRVSFRDNEQDIVTIEATNLPQNATPLLLGASQASRGHRFLSHGVPRTEQVLSSNGTITGYATLNGIQYLQLESSQVTPGFSGAPVFDEVTKRVVGMVVAIAPEDRHKRQGTTAFAVPAETLREIVPELKLSELCPYRSLDAFTEADAELFFGRERVVAKLLESLKRNPRFLAVLGPSGSGKSSVVGAGLIPALRDGQLSGSEKWGILSIRPGTQPFEQLTSAGMSDPTNLVQAASDWLATHPENERLLILIDQFEELLVSTPPKIRAEFVAALADLLDSSLDVTVMLTLRDDFYSRFVQDAEPLVGFLATSQTIIPPTLEEAELREIVERPARDLGLVFAPGLVDAIVADARTADPSGRAIRSTVLPLLEFALTQLWERRVDGELTHAEYRAMGGVTGGLSQWADRAYYALDDAERAIAQRIFSELVTLGDETQGIADTRRVRSIAELTAKDGEGTKSVLDALVTARLLVARHDESSRQDTVEIIHETLLREWALLESWLQDDRQFLLWREGLRAAQVAWQESGQDAGALLRGAPLAEAEDWLEKRGDDLGEAEKDYITKSVALRVRSERNRRWVMAGLGLVAVLMAGLAFWGSSSATEAREQANIAKANQAAAISQNYLLEKLDLALLLAVQGSEWENNFQTRDALLTAIQSNPNLLQIMYGHSNHVNSIAFSPDGKYISSGSDDGTIRFWDAQTGHQIGEPLSGRGPVNSVAFSPDGLYIVSGNLDNTLRLWDVNSRQQIGEPLTGHSKYVWSVAFSPDGSRIVSGSSDNTLRIWDANSGRQIGEPLTGHSRSIWSVAFSPDGSRIVSGSDDQTLRIWDADTGEQIGEPFAGHNWPVLSVAFSPDGSRIVSGSEDGAIRLWDADSRQQIGNPFIGHNGAVNSVAFSTDGNQIISGGDDKTVRVWNTDTGQQIGELFSGHSKSVNSVAFSPDGSHIVSGSDDQTICIWDDNSEEQVGEPLTGHNGPVWSVAFSPDSSRIVSGSFDQTLRIWDANSGRQIGEPLTGHSGSIWSVAFSPDGSRIVSGSDDQTLRIWDADTGEQIGEPLTGHNWPVLSVAFSPDGKRIVSGSSDTSLRLWDAYSGEQIGEPLTGHSNTVSSVAFSPDGSRIVSGGYDNVLRLWDADTGQQIGEYSGNIVLYVWSIAFSPDGSRIVSGSDDKTLRLWDADTGQQIGEPLRGHSGEVLSVAFSPDGSLIVSGSSDDTLRIWDANSGQQIGEPIALDHKAWILSISASGLHYSGHTGSISSIAFSPDEKIVASGSTDGTIRLWDMDINSWMAKACQRAGRNLTLQEWQTYFGENESYQITCPQWPVPEDALVIMEE